MADWITVITTSATSAAAVFGALSKFKELFKSRNAKVKEKYDFAKSFLVEVEKAPNVHPYLLRNGYFLLTDNRKVEPKIAAYLLHFSDFEEAVDHYAMGRIFLSEEKTETGRKFEFKRRLESWAIRFVIKLLAIVVYTSFFAFMFVTVDKDLKIGPQTISLYSFITVTVIIAAMALAAINVYARIRRAEKLIKSERKYLEAKQAEKLQFFQEQIKQVEKGTEAKVLTQRASTKQTKKQKKQTQPA